MNFMRLKVDFWWVWMPKWWFYQTSFEDQTINCKQMPRVQKHAKTVRFSMILRVRSIGRWKKKLWKNHEKLKLKQDMHVWWMFDWFWIDFQRISVSLWAKISLGMNFGIILSLFWGHGVALERWWGAWCWKIALRTKETLRRTSILNPKVGLRVSWKLPKASPKASQIG